MTENELFKKWQAKEKHQGKLFNCDGIVNVDEWEKEDCRILFLLKEAWHRKTMDGSEYDLAKDLRNSEPWSSMWNRVAEWTRGIHLTEEGKPAPYHKLKKSEAKLELQKIAVINIKKSGGESRSKDDDIMQYAEEDYDLIYDQIEMIDPTIIVCGYTIGFLNKIIQKSGEKPIDKKKNHCDNWHYKWKDRIVLDYYHPAYQVPALMAYYGIVGCYKDALENEHKGE